MSAGPLSNFPSMVLPRLPPKLVVELCSNVSNRVGLRGRIETYEEQFISGVSIILRIKDLMVMSVSPESGQVLHHRPRRGKREP